VKKDVLLALVIGFSIGTLIAFLAIKLPLFLASENSRQTASVNPQPSPSITSAKENIIQISSPQDQSILSGPEFELVGKLSTGAAVIVESALDSLVLTPDKNGTFSAELKLSEGSNQIFVTAVDAASVIESKTLKLFYTSEKL